MHRTWLTPGIRPETLNMAVVPSLSVRSTAALLTVLAMLSFWATKAARDDVTTSSAIMMKLRANAASCSTRLLRDRPPRRPIPADCTCGALMHAPSAGAGRSLSDYNVPPRGGDVDRVRPLVADPFGPGGGRLTPGRGRLPALVAAASCPD